MIATGMTKIATFRSDIASDNIIVFGGVRNRLTMMIDIITNKLPTAVTIHSTDKANAVTTAGKIRSSMSSLVVSSISPISVDINDESLITGNAG